MNWIFCWGTMKKNSLSQIFNPPVAVFCDISSDAWRKLHKTVSMLTPESLQMLQPSNWKTARRKAETLRCHYSVAYASGCCLQNLHGMLCKVRKAILTAVKRKCSKFKAQVACFANLQSVFMFMWFCWPRPNAQSCRNSSAGRTLVSRTPIHFPHCIAYLRKVCIKSGTV